MLDDDRRGAQAAKRTVTVDRERDDRVVHGHQGDRQVLALGVRDADLDLARLELHAPDVELVGGRRVAPEQVEERVARRGEERDGADEDEQRHERPEAPAVTPRRDGLRGHYSTSKKPIQPSSANSLWWAWNMKRPVFANSISRMPRSPWQSITVSVYSKWSVEPVG